MHDIIVIEQLSKIFPQAHGKEIIAVDNINLRIKRGEIFSLVGPDGAGKTTTIRMMCGVIPATKGNISVLDYDIKRQKDEIKNHIGYLSQRFSLYQDLTVDENIDFFAEIHRVGRYEERKEELLQFTRLTQYRNRLAGKLSGGMKQKLALACTLIHAPEIIFLDEPTTGVDPVSRRDFWKILSDLLKTGITIIISTPYLDEAERCTRVALMNQGKLLICDMPEVIISSFKFKIIEIVCDNVRNAVFFLQNVIDRKEIQLFGDRLHVLVKEESKIESEIKKLLKKNNIEIKSYRILPPSLEDIFIASMNS